MKSQHLKRAALFWEPCLLCTYRNKHCTHDQIGIAIRESIHGRTIDAEHSDDLAGTGFVNVFHIIRMHAYDTGKLHLFSVLHVSDRVSFLELALVDSHVRELPVLSLLELESQG